eukprot:TRINITY_DN24784_c0_g1_i1.p1 TRINITY_DN24784_c0_g1~~TRINITY_DN24784_c0_g1_i1.p1  ORF type:complete len:327 (+),score=98.09 TRINITY_DN24784_c0_g1_i1:58-1038(+)
MPRICLTGLPNGTRCLEDRAALEQLVKEHFTWFSYREGFDPIMEKLTTDKGWGCLHRVGQMMLMTTLRRHMALPKRDLLKHFMDIHTAIFSIQNITMTGRVYGKEPGEWFAPSTMAHVTRHLVEAEAERNVAGVFVDGQTQKRVPLGVEVVVDMQIRRDAILAKADAGGVLVLIPFMFGMDKMNHANSAFFRTCLASELCVGVLGGTAKHALYLIGFEVNSESFVSLDPHETQNAYMTPDTVGSLKAPRCGFTTPSTSSLDTSCLLCFYAKAGAEVESLLSMLADAQLEGSRWKIFTFVTDQQQAALAACCDDKCEEDEDDDWLEV